GVLARLGRWRPIHQPLELRFAPKRGECGIDSEPARREVIWDFQQGLELLQGLLRLTHQNVDADELMLNVGPEVGVFGHRQELHAASTLAHRVRLTAEISEGGTEEDVSLTILG